MSRLPIPTLEEMSKAQRRIHDEIASGPRGTVPAPQQIWLHAPDFCDVAQKLGAYCRYGSSLPTELSELAILVVGRHWQADYEWWAHARIAREAGLPEAIIEAIRVGQAPDFVDQDLRAEVIYETAKEMLETQRLTQDSYDRALAALGRQGLVEVVGIVGYYCLISLTLNVFDVKTPDGTQPFAGVAPNR
ncbi:MAG: carboxymuconolactone decarboxylase family protein [Pseudomonadota bacterium]